jgi:hypothetical protein
MGKSGTCSVRIGLWSRPLPGVFAEIPTIVPERKKYALVLFNVMSGEQASNSLSTSTLMYRKLGT